MSRPKFAGDLILADMQELVRRKCSPLSSDMRLHVP